MTRCYNECKCGKVHRVIKTKPVCPQCGREAIHDFTLGGSRYVFCEDHWDNKIKFYDGTVYELETLGE